VSTFDLGPALLFCPADRPERFQKAADRADAVILDLEDAVAPAAKAQARENVGAAELDADRVIVRVNAVSTDDFAADVDALRRSRFRRIMVAKAEEAAPLERIGDEFEVIALCETAKGVAASESLAAVERVTALMWGAEDLIASMGGRSSRTVAGEYREVARYARSRVLIAAAAAGKAAIDAVHLDIADRDGLSAEAADAAASGFAATACIHPGQVDVIREAYRPAPDEAEWARRVLAAAESERGVFAFEGRMVDEPVLRHARTVVSRAR